MEIVYIAMGLLALFIVAVVRLMEANAYLDRIIERQEDEWLREQSEKND